MSVNLSGVNSGIDTASIVQQLMAVNARSLTLLQNRMDQWTKKRDALAELQDLLSDFRTVAKTLDTSEKLRGFKTKSSDEDILTAQASSSAFEGSHRVVINQLAAAERNVHNAEFTYLDEKVGAGNFIYSYDHHEQVITTTADTTLEELANLINNDPSNPGVKASILKYNNKYHLALSGVNTGSDYGISINSSTTHTAKASAAFTTQGLEAGLTTKLTDLDQFSGNLGTTDKFTITGTAPDGSAITPVELTINSSTTVERLLDTITNAYNGQATAILENGKITLVDNTAGASQTTLNLAFTADPAGSAVFEVPTFSTPADWLKAATLTGFTQSSNFTTTQNAQDSKIQVDGYPASGWIERSSNTVDDVIAGVTLDLHTTGTVNLSLTRDTETLKGQLQDFVTKYNAVIDFIQENTAYDAATKVAGVLISNFTVSAVRGSIRTPFVSQADGFTQDVDSFLMTGHIGLEVDSTGKLKLDNTKLDAALAKDYNDVLDLIGANQIGSSDSSNIKFYSTSSKTKGGTYDVEVTFNAGTITSARTKLSSETSWRAASVMGNTVLGSVAINERTGQQQYPESGLGLTAEYAGTGTITAKVRVKQGFAGKLEDVIDNILATKYGSLYIDQKSANDAIEKIQKNMEKEQTRLDRVEKQLTAKFARMERALAMLQSQQQALNM